MFDGGCRTTMIGMRKVIFPATIYFASVMLSTTVEHNVFSKIININNMSGLKCSLYGVHNCKTMVGIYLLNFVPSLD